MNFGQCQVTRGRAAGALVALALLIYANGLGGGFVWDDEYLYLDNPNLLRETVWSALAGGNPSAYIQAPQAYRVYRPVQLLAYSWLARVFQLNPFGIHLASVVAHAASGLLVFLLVLELASLPVAWTTAALFIAHPLHVEAVAWMGSFSEVLAGCFSLLCLYALLRAKRSQVPSPTPQTPGPGTWDLRLGTWVFMGYLAALLAFLTKETTLGLPLLAILFAGWRRAGPLFPLAGLTLLLRWRSVGLASATFIHRPLWRQMDLVLTAALQYAKKAIWPWPLAVEYDLHHSPAAWVLFAAGCAAGAWLAYRSRWARLALGLALIALAPALTSAVAFPARRLAQDRFAYVAVLGLCLLLGRLAGNRKGLAVVLALLLVWSGLSVAAVSHWRDNEAFWSHTLAVTPDSRVAALGLGYRYYETKRFQEAERVYRRALVFYPNDPDLLVSLAAVQKAKGR